MEDNLKFKNINTRFDSIIKDYQEIHNLEVESKSKRQKIYESEIALIKNQHHSELEDVRTEQSEKNRKIISKKESEIVDLKNLHNLEVDRIKAEFQNELEKEIEKIKQQNINQIKQLKQQHQYELVEIRREINEKPKVTKISSEETTKPSDIK